jgi:hypothetical protein
VETDPTVLGDVKVALALGLTGIHTGTMVKIPYFLVWLLQALLLLTITRITLIILAFGVCVLVLQNGFLGIFYSIN